MRPLIRIAAAVAVAATLVACAPEPPSSVVRVSHPAKLAGTTWRLVEIAGAPPIAGPDTTLTFTGDQFGGSSPCNSLSGRYAYDSGTGALRFDQLISTKRACVVGPQSELEAAYFGALRTVGEADMDADGRLVLVHAGGRLVFEVAGQPVLAPPSVYPGPS